MTDWPPCEGEEIDLDCAVISNISGTGAEWTLQPMSKILRCMSKHSGSYVYVDAINFNGREKYSAMFA